MRVLIDYRPALRARSGVGAYVHELSRALSRQPGVRVTIFSSSWQDRLDAPDLGGLGVEAVDRRIPVRILNYSWHRWGFPPVGWLAGGEFDVVHSPSPLLVPARGAARVVTVNDLDFLKHPERVCAEIRRDYAALARRHVHRADLVLAISRYTAREAEQLLGLPTERIAICYPGVPNWVKEVRGTGSLAGGRPATVAHAPHARGTHILFIGTLEPRKNVGTLLDAYGRLLARLPSLPDLVLAGRATAAARPWLQAIEHPPLAGRVRHVGYVSERDLPALYDAAALLVLPSHDEGFGMPVLEALAMGVPVVAANRGALPEVAGDAGLLVDPDDVEALAGAIGSMLTDQALAAESVRRGLEQSRRFDWDETARTVVAAYARAIERRRERAASGQ